MPIFQVHEEAVPFSRARLVEYAAPSHSTESAPQEKGTTSTKTIASAWEWVCFIFEEDETMPPRAVGKPNWQLILTAVSMFITVMTLITAGIWGASQKSTNLDMVSANIATNTADIKSANSAIMDLKLDIKGLKDQNQQLMEQLAEMRIEMQAKQNK